MAHVMIRKSEVIPEIPEGDTMMSSVERGGITWEFDTDYPVGQFCNGDYYVVAPGGLNIIGITPACTIENGYVINGAMIDPNPEQVLDAIRNQGFGSTVPNYNIDYNNALPGGNALSAENPMSVSAGSCVVSSISTTTGNGGYPNTAFTYVTHLKEVEILTVLSVTPDSGSFRPGYCLASKTVTLNESSLNYALLGTYAITEAIETEMLTESIFTSKGGVSTAVDCLNNMALWFQRPWLDYVSFSTGRPYHPLDNMPEYGANMSDFISMAAVMLHLDYTNLQKRNLLINFIQYGIDCYSICTNGTQGRKTWPGGGGMSSGRKWPILFAGIMLNDTDMKAIGSKSGDYAFNDGNYLDSTRLGPTLPADYIHFGEDDQTFVVTSELVTTHAAYSHDPADYTPPSEGNLEDGSYSSPPEFYNDYDAEQWFYPYKSGDIGLAEYGQKHFSYPGGVLAFDTKYWYESYRHVNAPAWTGFILAALIMQDSEAADVLTLWNHDVLFDYIDRYVTIQETLYPGYQPHSNGTVRLIWNTYYSGLVW